MSATVLAYLRVLIWPAIVCVLAFGFRSTLRSLLRVRLTQLDAPGFSAKFEKVAEEAERVVRPGPSEAPSRPTGVYPANLVVITPHSYEEARNIGEVYRDGKPVLADLEELGDTDAKRLVDFMAGLIFTAHGFMERIGNRVFLLGQPETAPPAE